MSNNYSIYAIAGISFLILFTIQYALCKKAKHKIIEYLPFIYIFFILLLAIIAFTETSGGGFLNLNAVVAILLLIYACICILAVFLARFLCSRIDKNN